MMTNRLLIVAIVAILPAIAINAGQALLVDVRTSSDPATGKAPALLITPNRDLASITISFTRRAPDGSTERIVLSPRLRMGVENEVPLPHPGTRFSWQGTLAASFKDGTEGEMPLSFDTNTLGGMQIDASRVTLEDVLARRVILKTDRYMDRAEIEVSGDGGKNLGRTEVDLGGAAPGNELVISWEQPLEGDPLLVYLKLFDVEGSWRGIRWMPWRVTIPHDTLVFDTGKSSIREDQEPKLQAVLNELNRQLARYDGLVDAEVSLWIAGHTDTVGPRDNNLRLSEARARSIATWFRRAGVKGTIQYRGFGQESLLVGTPDNVDEPRNRRAEYLVAGADPYAGKSLPGTWKKLP